MVKFRVRKGEAGWFIDAAAVSYGPYRREDKAIAAAESLNRQARENARQIIPSRQSLVQEQPFTA